MVGFYTLEPGRWAGLTEAPVPHGWPAGSPVFVETVTPLKTGRGRLLLDVLQPLHPRGGRRRTIDARVVQRAPLHVTCVFDEDGERRTAIFAKPDFAWLASCAPDLLARRPPSGPTFIVDGEPVGAPTWEDHLAATFGAGVEELLGGASGKSFAVKLGRMPEQHALVSIGEELGPFDAALVTRGFTPRRMEDKWFVIHDEGRLRFRRSWTGVLIYDVEAVWRGDRLYLGQAMVNRRPEQYAETDDAYDGEVLRYLVDVVLKGVPARFPVKRTDAQAVLQAWSAAGAASLG